MQNTADPLLARPNPCAEPLYREPLKRAKPDIWRSTTSYFRSFASLFRQIPVCAGVLRRSGKNRSFMKTTEKLASSTDLESAAHLGRSIAEWPPVTWQQGLYYFESHSRILPVTRVPSGVCAGRKTTPFRIGSLYLYKSLNIPRQLSHALEVSILLPEEAPFQGFHQDVAPPQIPGLGNQWHFGDHPLPAGDIHSSLL